MPIKTQPPILAITLTTLLLVLAGCGYRLAGQFGFANNLSPLQWQAEVEGEALFTSLSDSLSLYEIQLGLQPAANRLELHQLSANTIDLADDKILSLTAKWSLVNGQDVRVIQQQAVQADTRLSFSTWLDEDEAEAERFAYLHQRLAQQIIQQLEAITAADLAKQPKPKPQNSGY